MGQPCEQRRERLARPSTPPSAMRALACSGGQGCYWATTSGETRAGMTTNNTPTTCTPHCCCEQLLAGWIGGAQRMMSDKQSMGGVPVRVTRMVCVPSQPRVRVAKNTRANLYIKVATASRASASLPQERRGRGGPTRRPATGLGDVVIFFLFQI